MRRAGWGSDDHNIVRIVNCRNPIAKHPSKVVGRCDAFVAVLGKPVDEFAAGYPNFDRADVLEVARHGCLGRFDVFGFEQLDELGLRSNRHVAEQLNDPMLS